MLLNTYSYLWNKFCGNLKEKNLFRELKQKNTQFQDYIDFSSNDYLALSNHPYVINKSNKYLAEHGATSGGSRLLSGNLPMFEELEGQIAKAKNSEASIVFNSAYQTNTSVIAALLNKRIVPNAVVFADKLVHASIYDGFNSARVMPLRYRHLDMTHLEDLLKEHKSTKEKFIFSETSFSMDGDSINLSDINFLSKKYNAFLYLDEAHSIGLQGVHGYGITLGSASRMPCELENGVSIGSFSKALGSFGGFIACSKNLKTYLINQCKGFIYSTSLPPSIIGANEAAWELLPSFDKEREHIAHLSTSLRAKLMANHFNIGNSSTNIIPIIIGSEEKTLALASRLKQNNVLVSAIRPPSVPIHTSRLRITVNAQHSQADIEKLLKLLIDLI